MSRVFIGIGSNEGDRLRLISQAAQCLGALPGTKVVQMAPIIETDPIGPPQPRYLNTVVEISTDLEPSALLRGLKHIEAQLGRRPSGERWGPRPIDLDLLLYDARVIEQPDLRVPHPLMQERRFVLEPLAELAPGVVHPVLRQPIASLLARLPRESSAPDGAESAGEPMAW